MWETVSRTAGGRTGHSTQQLTTQISSNFTSNAGYHKDGGVIQEKKNTASNYGPRAIK
jgi:hypothetical protein